MGAELLCEACGGTGKVRRRLLSRRCPACKGTGQSRVARREALATGSQVRPMEIDEGGRMVPFCLERGLALVCEKGMRIERMRPCYPPPDEGHAKVEITGHVDRQGRDYPSTTLGHITSFVPGPPEAPANVMRIRL